MEMPESYTPEQLEMLARSLRELLTREINKPGVVQQSVGRITRVSQPALSRFVNGASLKLESVAVLLDYFGYEIKPKGEPEQAKAKPARKKARQPVKAKRKGKR